LKILFISSNLIGDSILSTGVLSYLIEKYPNSKITVVSGPTSRQLFENFPNLERIVAIKKMKYNLHWIVMWSKIINNKWDLIIDLRSSFISYIVFSKKRKIFKKNNTNILQVKKLSNFMNVTDILKPKIYSNNEEDDLAKKIIGNKVVIAIAPGGNWTPKVWPIEKYNQMILKLKKLYQNRQIYFLIVGSKKEEKIYFKNLTKNIDTRYLINIMGTSLTLTYSYLSQCKLFIGNDSGLMHLSAATGIKTIGLFGPTRDDWYAPFGDNCFVIRTKETYDELKSTSNDSNQSLMNSIESDQLINYILNNNLL
tara:strand:+ start:1796 stop:2725 length:930 start_codon:yes stop_codon:yes gene_type:complete